MNQSLTRRFVNILSFLFISDWLYNFRKERSTGNIFSFNISWSSTLWNVGKSFAVALSLSIKCGTKCWCLNFPHSEFFFLSVTFCWPFLSFYGCVVGSHHLSFKSVISGDLNLSLVVVVFHRILFFPQLLFLFCINLSVTVSYLLSYL